MRIRFWGTRGSVAVPGPGTVRYGGNTSCVEVLTESTAPTLILDCGTGFRELGNDLALRTPVPTDLHILLSHTHWDHIQGFPFAPAFQTDKHIVIYSAVGQNKHLSDVLAGQMEYTYFPVTIPQMGAHIEVRDVGVTHNLRIGNAHISTHYLNHTTTCLGFRIECDGASLSYTTDHESFARFVRDLSPEARPQQRAEMSPANLARGQDAEAAYLDFIRDSDLLITDAQYTEEEYASHLGWGHSTCDDAVRTALQAGVKRLALYHHDPGHTDDAIDHILAHCRRLVEQAHGSLEIIAAAERQVIELPSRSGAST